MQRWHTRQGLMRLGSRHHEADEADVEQHHAQRLIRCSRWVD